MFLFSLPFSRDFENFEKLDYVPSAILNGSLTIAPSNNILGLVLAGIFNSRSVYKIILAATLSDFEHFRCFQVNFSISLEVFRILKLQSTDSNSTVNLSIF